MNLTLNAFEALGNALSRVHLRIADTAVDGCLALTCTDSGAGRDQETPRRIFEPFFTRKVTGRGLSLAAVAGIAN